NVDGALCSSAGSTTVMLFPTLTFALLTRNLRPRTLASLPGIRLPKWVLPAIILSELTSRPGVGDRVESTLAFRPRALSPAPFRRNTAIVRGFPRRPPAAHAQPATPRRKPESGRLHPGRD